MRPLARGVGRTPHSMTSAKTPRPPQSRTRKIVKGVLILIGVCVGGYYALTQGFLGRWIIESVLSSRVGASASLSGIHVHKNGRTDLFGLRFRVPGVPGKPGTFFEADRLVVDLDTSNWMKGEIGLQAVAAHGIVARISQDSTNEKVNIQNWSPPSGGGVGTLPRVVVQSGRIELCEHTGENLTVLKSIDIHGNVEPDTSDSVRINFQETRTQPDGSVRTGMIVRGRMTPFGLEFALTNASLNDWPIETVPLRFRPFFTDLAITGDITRAHLRYSFKQSGDMHPEDMIQGVMATLDLKDLGVSLPFITDQQRMMSPIAAPLDRGATPNLMRVQAKEGSITFTGGRAQAQLSGSVEGIPYTVKATYNGTSPTSPFEAVFILGEFTLKKDSPVLRFATPLVMERLEDFGRPEGIVTARVVVSRQEGKEVKTLGEVRLDEGTAAFHRFPYRFEHLKALIFFTENEVVIHRVEGTAPSGATIVADGRISPITDDAEVLVHVRADKLPIDHRVEEALGPKRSRLIKRIFNRDRYEELVERGDIRRPPEPGEPDSPDPDAPPVFSLGGRASIDVKVTRDFGSGVDPWHDTIQVNIADAGLLPERFPYPLKARLVRAVITDGMVRLDRVPLQGLRGGTVVISSELDARQRPDDVPDPDPTIHIEGTDIPVDRTLVQALPDKKVEGRSARSVVSALGLTGTVNATADLTPRPDGDLGVRVEVVPRSLEALPRLGTSSSTVPSPLAGDVLLTDLKGTIVLEDDRLLLDLAGGAASESGRVSAKATLPSPFKLQADADLSMKGRSRIDFDATQLDLTLPLEGVLAIVAPSAGATLAELRETYLPAGHLDLRTRTTVETGGTNAKIDLSALQAARITLPGVPGAESAEVSITSTRGTLTIRPGDGGRPTSVECSDFEAKVSSGSTPDGTVTANGVAALRAGVLAHPADRESSLSLRWTGAQIGSPLCRWIGSAVLGELAGELHERHKPEGPFDLSLRIVPGGRIPEVAGEVRPHALTLTMSDGVVQFNNISGLATFDRHSVAFEKAELSAEKWSVTATGGWKRDDAGRSEGNILLAIDSMGVPADLVAAAPAGVCDALRDLKVDASGMVRIPRIDVRAWWDSPESEHSGGRPDRLKASGNLHIEGGRADAGVDITDATGDVAFQAARDGRDALLRYDLNGTFPQLRLAGIQITQGRVHVVSGDQPGETFVPLVAGDCHGGRLSAQVAVFPTDPRKTEGERDFDVQVALSGVTLGPVIEDLRNKLAADRPKDAGEQKAAAEGGNSAAASAARSEAKLDVGMTLAGTLGKPETRRGRGIASAGQGTLVSLPLLTRLAEASNLMLPLGEPLDLLQAYYFVQGRTVSFEELSIFSASVEFLGFGTLAWPDMNLDMVFTHRATNRVPIVGHIVEGLRNELVTTTVGGTVADPEFGVSSMRGTRGFLERIFGGPTSLQDKRMQELEQRGERGGERIRIEPKSTK